MKNFLLITIVLLSTCIYGQNISDYRYVQIDSKDYENGKYGLTDLLASKLKQKNYTVLNVDTDILQSNVTPEPCDILTAFLSDTGNMFRNKVKIEFKDCTNKTLLSEEGSSRMKDFESGTRDALQNALIKIPVSNPVARVQYKKFLHQKSLHQKSLHQ
ncbi:hypothetical protein [Kaistella palustris]|uniref:hypothetical protein n=1 Tax=Kaistella palustris TaxID=493376 RepID=UPI00041871F0|nr:hypothetical protein [Kaistella palustris]